MARKIITVGGGGFLLFDTRHLQERYILDHVHHAMRGRDEPRTQRRPHALFLGTASGDSERAQLNFIKTFTALGCEANVLTFFPYEMKRDYRQAVLDADLIYVGGGNTVGMVAVWREFLFDRALREAYEGGTVLAGISAGANCWFEQYVTDSVPGGGVREGLGFVPGTFCPHLDSEEWRQPLLARSQTPALGCGEHVLMYFEDGVFKEAVHDMPARIRVEPMAMMVSDARLARVEVRPLTN